MFSLLKTVLTVAFLVQFSSSAVIRKDGEKHHDIPWWPFPPWLPTHHSHSTKSSITSTLPSSTGTTSSHLSTTISTTAAATSSAAVTSPIPTSPQPATSIPVTTTVPVPPNSTSKPSPTISSTSTVTVPITSVQSTSVPNITPTSTSTTPPATSTSSGAYWKPSVGATWQIELSGTVTDTTYNADVFDVDLFDTPVSTISTLRANGKKVICYFSAGSYENWRPDQAEFLPSDKGSPLDGWPGEWWLNTSSPNVRNIMTNRIILAATNGCDGIDPDNVDGYDNDNGLGLTTDTAIDYMNFLSNQAHSRGLAIGLKNAAEIVSSVLPNVEWQVNEQCVQYDECDVFRPFIDAGKPVFHIEYPSDAPDVSSSVKAENCGAVSASGFSTVLKTTDLDAWIDPC